MTVLKSILKSIIPYILIVLFVLILFRYVVMVAYIPSGSMEHTLETGDSVIFNRLAYIKQAPKQGDIIAFYSEELEDILCKRVIGVGGDEISIKDSTVTVNGEVLTEDYIQKDTDPEPYEKSFTVPDGCVFVMGDNRKISYDARYWENPYISNSAIMGRYVFTMPEFVGKIQGFFIKMRNNSN